MVNGPRSILQLITTRQYRGAQVFAAQLSEGLVAQGHAVTLAGLYSPPAFPLEANGARLVDLNGKRTRLWNHALVWQVARLIQEEQPAIIQANGADTLKYAILARRKLGIRTPIIYRNISIASQWLRSPVHRWFNAWLFRQVDHVASVSEAARDDIMVTYGLSPEKVTTIPIGTPIPERVDKVAARAYLEQLVSKPLPGPVLLHIGAFSPEKNHAGLLRIFQQVKKTIPEAELVCVGDGPLFTTIQQQVQALPERESIYLLGTRKDIPQFIAAADVFVLPSLIEGLPGVVLEAGAHGVPIVGYAVGSVQDGVAEKDLLVPVGEEDAVAAAIQQLLHDNDKWEAAGRSNREWVQSHYGLEVIVQQFNQLYGRLQ